jgi:serine protease Do
MGASRLKCVISIVLLPLLTGGGVAAAEERIDPRALYERVTPSLVAVQYTWDSEMGRRELVGAGIIVGEHGLVMTSLHVFDLRIPDEQMKEFKVIVPREEGDALELDAVFLGRDERTNLAFVQTAETQQWQALEFEEAPVNVGDGALSVGLLPKGAGYRAYYMESTVSAVLRGEVPQVLVTAGGLAAVGSPVFSRDGRAIGLVNAQPEQGIFLNDPRASAAAILTPPRFFVPTRDFRLSLEDPPSQEEPVALPWLGLPQLTGLQKEVAEFFGLEETPAIEVGDVVAGSPADRAGVTAGQMIVEVNGEPLERGDEPEELPGIFRRKILRMPPGTEVTLGLFTARDEPLQEITVRLGEQPKRAHQAERFFASDLGFTAREIVFHDTYVRRLPSDQPGVIVALTLPQGAAQNAGLETNDLVVELNAQPVAGVEEFREMYETLRRDRPREAVVMVVIREGSTQVIRIESPQ